MLSPNSIRFGFCVALFLFAVAAPGYAFQTPGFYYDEDRTLCELARTSDLIVTARVTETLWVADPVEKEKEYKRWNDSVSKSTGTETIVDLGNFPKTEKFVIGTLFTFEIGEVIYSKKKLKENTSILVFVAGYPLRFHTGIPHFSPANNYLLHLSSAQNESFPPDAKIMKIGVEENMDLEPLNGRTFVVAKGAVRFHAIPENDTALVDKAKRFTEQRKSCAVK